MHKLRYTHVFCISTVPGVHSLKGVGGFGTFGANLVLR